MVIFVRKGYTRRVWQAVSVSHDFSFAGVRLFGSVLTLWMHPAAQGCGVNFIPVLLQNRDQLGKMESKEGKGKS